MERVFDEQREERLKNAAAREKTFRQGLASQREALEPLARPPVLPFTPYYLYLDTPFLIWEIPHPTLDLLRDSHVESFGSWVRINVDYKNGIEPDMVHVLLLWFCDDPRATSPALFGSNRTDVPRIFLEDGRQPFAIVRSHAGQSELSDVSNPSEIGGRVRSKCAFHIRVHEWGVVLEGRNQCGLRQHGFELFDHVSVYHSRGSVGLGSPASMRMHTE